MKSSVSAESFISHELEITYLIMVSSLVNFNVLYSSFHKIMYLKTEHFTKFPPPFTKHFVKQNADNKIVTHLQQFVKMHIYRYILS